MARYSLGIDLGTTHSALSYFNLEEGQARGPGQAMLPIPQLTAPGTTDARQLLPSFLYLAGPQEFPPGSLGLPWAPERGEVVGEFARAHGAKVPGRLVSSAKSWLSHAGVDRKGPLLPWQAPPEVHRVAPVEASARYLAHLREAWNHAFGEAGARLEDQDVIVTVPASFDAAARELTLEAARAAGYPTLTLLEEPQAALYAWLEVGGGTSDFSLISVGESGGVVQLTRLAVGDHILLGGDNMDLALAHFLAARLKEGGKSLDAVQFNGLTYAARHAKEQLFSDTTLGEAPVAVAARGSALIGGTVKTELSREDLNRLLTDGFFPRTPVTEMPRTARRTGLTQMALPYAQDAGVTRHLAAFLTRQARALEASQEAPAGLGGRSFIHPTAILFNGGVFKAGPLKERLLEVLNGWLTADGGQPVKELSGADLDLSVARGAAYYGWVRQGHGLRIRGGTARAYYVGVEAAMPAVPGVEPPVRALCVAPFGMEEGTQADVPPQEFGLVVGEPTRFRFFSSSLRRDDRVGTMLEHAEEEEGLEEVAPLETALPPQDGQQPGEVVPVNLQAAVTEVGTLELRCLQKDGPGRWKLELNVRMKE
jgi:hypothetical protein